MYKIIFFLIIISQSFLWGAIHYEGQYKENLQALKQEIQIAMLEHPEYYQKLDDYYYKINPAEVLVFRIESNMFHAFYPDCVEQLYQLESLVDDKENEVLEFQYYWLSVQVNRAMGIDYNVEKDLNTMASIAAKMKNLNKKNLLQSNLVVDRSSIEHLSNKNKIQFLLQALQLNTEINNVFYQCRMHFLLGEIFLDMGETDSAFIYYNRSAETAEQNQLGKLIKSYGQVGQARVLLRENKPQDALLILEAVKKTIELSPDFLLKEDFYKTYAEVSGALGQTHISYFADSIVLSLQQKKEKAKNKGRAMLVSKMEEKQKSTLQKRRGQWNNVIWTTFGFIFIAFSGLYIVFKLKSQRVPKVNPKDFNIPEKTKQELLKKLKKFEESNGFINKNISLNHLAQQLNTNPRYLSGVINKHKTLNFNTYINNLRVEYIVKKLIENPNYRIYKISYLAEESGFSSHSLFTTVFKNKMKKSPIDFIQNLD